MKDGQSAPARTTPDLPVLPTAPPEWKLPAPIPLASPRANATPLLHTPLPTQTPMPAPMPSAFAQANVFEIGSAPPNTYAGPYDAPQIFYARFEPTVLHNGVPVTVSAITTHNVTKVTIGTPGFTTGLVQIAPAKWQATYTFNAFGSSPGQNTGNLLLRAYRSDGQAATVQIPVSVQSGG